MEEVEETVMQNCSDGVGAGVCNSNGESGKFKSISFSVQDSDVESGIDSLQMIQ